MQHDTGRAVTKLKRGGQRTETQERNATRETRAQGAAARRL